MEMKQELVMVDGRLFDRASAIALAIAPFEVDGWMANREDFFDVNNRIGHGAKDPQDTAQDGVIGDLYRVRFFRNGNVVRVVRVAAPDMVWDLFRDRGGWTARCESLRLDTWGLTYAELIESISETIDAWIRSQIDDDELDLALSERGWKTLDDVPTDITTTMFDVPYSINIVQG